MAQLGQFCPCSSSFRRGRCRLLVRALTQTSSSDRFKQLSTSDEVAVELDDLRDRLEDALAENAQLRARLAMTASARGGGSGGEGGGALSPLADGRHTNASYTPQQSPSRLSGAV